MLRQLSFSRHSPDAEVSDFELKAIFFVALNEGTRPL
jgi:hypothetical protein